VARTVPIICLLALLAGCGGGGDDREKAQQAVRDFVAATREKDADAFCDELVTQEFLEQATGATGDQATQSCKREFDSLTGVDVKVVRIVRTQVDDDTARVTAVLARGGEELRQTLRLKKEDGDWKLAGSAE
jgi:predicted lipid-binding transport protein (Tim44 family)